MKHVYGPIPSRRLGHSLGVDIVPMKTCTFDCVYCQLGSSSMKSIRRRSFFPPADIMRDIQETLDSKVHIDFITFSGSGEPTLNSDLGRLITSIKTITDIQVAVITNGSLIWNEDVRSDLLRADLVVPSLDAGSEAVFQRLNRPHPDLHLESIIDGLIQFRLEYRGLLWLEVFLVEGINTSDDEIERIVDAVSRIQPDKVQLNTAVRPPAEPSVKPLSRERLEEYVHRFSCPTEVIADYSAVPGDDDGQDVSDRIIEVLKRRPCTVDGLGASLQVHRNVLLKHLDMLLRKATITAQLHNGERYFSIPAESHSEANDA